MGIKGLGTELAKKTEIFITQHTQKLYSSGIGFAITSKNTYKKLSWIQASEKFKNLPRPFFGPRSVLFFMPTKLQSISWPSPFKCGRQLSFFQYSLLNKKRPVKAASSWCKSRFEQGVRKTGPLEWFLRRRRDKCLWFQNHFRGGTIFAWGKPVTVTCPAVFCE